MLKQLSLFLLIMALFSSCKLLNPSLMLHTPKDYKYDETPKVVDREARLNPNDQITMLVFTNDGFKLLDLTSETRINTNQMANSTFYRVEFDSLVNLPIIGRVKLGGLTIREAEAALEEAYATYYIQPFVLLKITNRKVLVFNGVDGGAKIVPLPDETTNLLRVIAQAGGISRAGRAYDIKVIRGEYATPKVYHFSLRTMEDLKKADFIMESNDVVYVTPSPQVARKLMTEIGPYLSLLTTLLLVINYFKK